MTTGAHNDVLRAARIRQRLLVTRGHPDPERVGRDLHYALHTHLRDALVAAFAGAGTANDDSVWRIRSLALDMTINAQWDAQLLARAWAVQLAQAVRRTIARGGDGVLVMRWPSRAAYLASFVREAVDGTAASRWWFDSFSGLRTLTRSSQIRTALVRDAPLGAAALVLLPAPDVALVAAQLATADARLVLDAIAPAAADPDADAAAAAVLEAHRALGAPAPRGDAEGWSLRVVVEALRTHRDMRTGPIAGIARAVARLWQVAAEQPARMAVVHRILASHNAAGLRLVLGDSDAERLAPLARVSRPVLDDLAERAADTTPAAVPDEEPGVTWMPIAAPLVLAPFAAALPLDETTRGWPGIGEAGAPAARCATAAALTRLFILAAACGGERAARVIADPTVRLLAGVGTGVQTGELRDWAGRFDASHAASLEQALGEWRIRRGTVSCETWLLTEVASGDHALPPSLALLDCARGHWLALRAEGPVHERLSALRYWLDRAAPESVRELLVTNETLAEAVGTMALSAINVRPAPDPSQLPAGEDPVTATLARRDRLAGELDWLALPASLGVPRTVELALAAAAQGILRDLAHNLPGFARASLPHLWANFLAVDAHVAQEPQRLVARVGRPPLSMVIAMTGLMRTTYTLPWLQGMQVALFPSDGA